MMQLLGLAIYGVYLWGFTIWAIAPRDPARRLDRIERKLK